MNYLEKYPIKFESFDVLNQYISTQYSSGKNIRKIASELNVTKGTILYRLKQLNVVRRSTLNIRKYQINENIFATLDTHIKAYLLGFITADGCIYHKNSQYTLAIKLSAKDLEHLYTIRTSLESTHPIEEFIEKGNSMCRIRISSTRIARDLAYFGVLPRKTKTILWPTNIPEKYMSSYLLGEFDGDGCWLDKINGKYHYPNFCVSSGSTEYLDGLTDFIYQKFGFEKATLNKNTKEGWDVRYHGYAKCQQLYEYMYKDSPIGLARKKIRIEEILGRSSTDLT